MGCGEGDLASVPAPVAEVLLTPVPMGTGLFTGRRPAASSGASRPGEKPCSVATEENLSGTVISLLSRNTAWFVVFRCVFHRLLLPSGFTQRSSLSEERETQGGGLVSCLPLPQPLVLSFPTVE